MAMPEVVLEIGKIRMCGFAVVMVLSWGGTRLIDCLMESLEV